MLTAIMRTAPIPIILFLLSIGIQLAAAIYALLLIRLTGRKLAWTLISIALVLMTWRHIAALISILTSGEQISFDLSELIALVTSFLILLGVLRIGDYFRSINSADTARKRLEESLQESENEFRDLAEKSVVGIYLIQDGIFKYVNPMLAEIFGYTDRELIDKKGPEYLVLPQDWPIVRENLRKRISGEIESSHYSFRGIKKNKEIIYVEVYGSKTVYKARHAVIGTLLDITERKKAGEELRRIEKKYKDLFDTTLDGIYQVDVDGVFVLMNPAGARIFGYESPDEIIGRNAIEYWRDPKDREVFRAELKIKKTVSGYHMRARKKNGEPIELESTSTIREDENGNFLGIEGILRDVTERKKIEDQLRQAQKMEAVGQLAGGIAHDFNNILTAIIGYGHLLHMKMRSDDPLSVNVEQILESADRAASLTQNLLAFSRKQIMNARHVDLNELIKKVEGLLLRIIGEDIEVTTTLSKEVLTVNVDSAQIEQALLNLATNARDAMPHGGRLSIETESVVIDDGFIKAHGFGEPGKYAIISITDSGTGMDKETRDKIFEPFFTTKEVGKGTGLGLAMVYGTVKQHNGYITVYSEPGKGTTFRIYIPLVELKIKEQQEAVLPALPVGGAETILVAEDEPVLRKLDSEVLTEYGYNVIVAEDGQDAINKFTENKDRIQMCILDMVMPKKSGKEAYEAIKKIKPEIKVLFTSGYAADKISVEDFLEEGFNFMRKPISPEELLKKIRAVLDL